MRRISRVTPITCQSSYEISEGWNRDRVVSQAKAFAIAAEGWKTYADVTVKNVGDRVAAVDPSEQFVEAARARHPGVDVRLAAAEALPFSDDEFDAALAQLVVHFMADPVAGLREMARVTSAGGVVAACVWDHDGGRSPIAHFWEAVRQFDPDADAEAGRPGARKGHPLELFRAAGLGEVEESEVSAAAEYKTFEQWWEPLDLGIGPAGAYAQSLGDAEVEELKELCRGVLPELPFRLTAYAWAVRGR